ncbi:hypothetical protein HYH03_013127 [Edaphochlamys debaryana]|uniref:Uncharacterized protein n=1 Tax=Edaphochlamys debaryana TaxID=47281 RepID=A0A836BTN7_9CHLO|nr:hypothetical protein HYH03_013127 [Edaphochlamys debaryana]|eukprot:KAG2488277.1 hypothetical protein HYH03_013127 [Edaphochlamys debaryana]
MVARCDVEDAASSAAACSAQLPLDILRLVQACLVPTPTALALGRTCRALRDDMREVSSVSLQIDGQDDPQPSPGVRGVVVNVRCRGRGTERLCGRLLSLGRWIWLQQLEVYTAPTAAQRTVFGPRCLAALGRLTSLTRLSVTAWLRPAGSAEGCGGVGTGLCELARLEQLEVLHLRLPEGTHPLSVYETPAWSFHDVGLQSLGRLREAALSVELASPPLLRGLARCPGLRRLELLDVTAGGYGKWDDADPDPCNITQTRLANLTQLESVFVAFSSLREDSNDPGANTEALKYLVLAFARLSDARVARGLSPLEPEFNLRPPLPPPGGPGPRLVAPSFLDGGLAWLPLHLPHFRCAGLEPACVRPSPVDLSLRTPPSSSSPPQPRPHSFSLSTVAAPSAWPGMQAEAGDGVRTPPRRRGPAAAAAKQAALADASVEPLASPTPVLPATPAAAFATSDGSSGGDADTPLGPPPAKRRRKAASVAAAPEVAEAEPASGGSKSRRGSSRARSAAVAAATANAAATAAAVPAAAGATAAIGGDVMAVGLAAHSAAVAVASAAVAEALAPVASGRRSRRGTAAAAAATTAEGADGAPSPGPAPATKPRRGGGTKRRAPAAATADGDGVAAPLTAANDADSSEPTEGDGDDGSGSGGGGSATAPRRSRARAAPKEPKAPRVTKAMREEEARQAASRGDIAPHLTLHDRYPHSRTYGRGAVPLAPEALAAAEAENARLAEAAAAAAAELAAQEAAALAEQEAAAAAAAEEAEEGEEDEDEDEQPAKGRGKGKGKANGKGRAPAKPKPPKGPPPVPFVRRALPPRLPVLGYACLCDTMRSNGIFTSRDTNKKGFDSKGLPHVSKLALANARDLLPLIHWNEAHGIRLFRLSSCIFPWMSFYRLEDLPDAEDIKQALAAAGEAATRLGHRLTFHPSEFTKIASDRSEVVDTSVKELEVHSRIFDLMGFLPATVYNKINFHVGAVYGDKIASMDRFADVVLNRLSPNCRARITVENDDRASMYSVRDLTYLSAKAGIPIVFDFHHHRFCTGGMSEEEAFRTALATWPPGVKPIVHWSESQEGRRAHAHSDYISGPINLYGLEDEVDVMIESKAKELALLHYREAALAGRLPERPQAEAGEEAGEREEDE